MDLLFNVWREASRHVAIEDSVERITELIASHLPADLLSVRRIDVERRQIDTVAPGSGVGVAASPRTECTSDQMQSILEWARSGNVRRGNLRNGDVVLTAVAPAGPWADVLAGPLVEGENTLGVLVVAATSPLKFGAHHETLVRRLLEPFAVALANDTRLRELGRLRESLEADKSALLSRLQRNDVADTIVGADSGLRRVMERVERVAPTDAPVLLLGATGSGKEVVARAIHARSRRSAGPVVRVNCGAIPSGLVDSELFGHERGSFTGAIATRKGWFERADGGTLFLDEVAELPLDAQVRLLRILQDGTLERVGGQRSLHVDVRIVTATHRDLGSMVAAKTFREDLWYRIGVFPIHIPALRERIEDIPALASHFAWRAGTRLGGLPLAPTPRDIELLLAYDWPGNVRELASVIERAAILGDGKALDVAGSLGLARPVENAVRSPMAPDTSFVIPLDDAMRQHIERALHATGGRVEGKRGAAALLGINPHTLRARMRKLGIEWGKVREQLTGNS